MLLLLLLPALEKPLLLVVNWECFKGFVKKHFMLQLSK